MLVEDIQPGEKGSSIECLASVGDTLYFAAREGEDTEYDLWSATASGAQKLKAFNAPTVCPIRGGVNNRMVIHVDLATSASLYSSDGTVAGTVEIAHSDNVIGEDDDD